MWIGVLVSPPFSPAKFGPLSTSCCRQILERRFVRTLTTSFRKHSNNRIGCVRPRLYSHSYGLGIGYSWETRHLSGMFPSLNRVPAKVRRISCVAGLAFFIKRYPIPNMPEAVSVLQDLRTSFHSASVGCCMMSL